MTTEQEDVDHEEQEEGEQLDPDPYSFRNLLVKIRANSVHIVDLQEVRERLDNDQVQILVRALQSNMSVSELCVRHCMFNDEVRLKTLLAGLQTSRITDLDLSLNFI